MNRIQSTLLFAASLVCAVCIAFFPGGVFAAEIRVPQDFLTIQDAISSATFTSGDSVVVGPGIYFGPITLPHNITIKGTETARTFLSGNGGGPVVTTDETATAGISSLNNVKIQNFTFVNASSGINIRNNSSTISITNNVFQVGPGGAAVTIQNSALTEIANNTFYQNGAALTCDADIRIFNNIFSLNNTAISDTAPSTINIANNAFSGNVVSGPTGTNTIVADPLFVSPVNHDFHLQEGSPCINAGNNSGTPNDIGAYGGTFADTIPFPVTGLSILSVTISATDASIGLTWSPNLSYLVTNTDPSRAGGYGLHFGSAPGDYTCTVATCGVASPIALRSLAAEPLNNATLNGLTFSTTLPSAPDTVQSSPGDSRLVLTWSAAPGATGYKVHYGISSLDENDPIDVGNTTSYELSGLTNGQKYFVAVSAYAWQQYYFAITAQNHTDTTTIQESVYSTETSTRIGPTQESGLSPVISDFPEPVITYPALPDSGGHCFIATAAYGYYSAPEVQALRAFRDRYLLSSAPGRMFVQWYYRRGPVAAAFLNEHPGYKPLVRAALMPAVGAAMFMTGTSILFKTCVFLVLGAVIAFGFFRKRLSRTFLNTLFSFLIFMLMLFPSSAMAEDPTLSRPHWSLEIKGGRFTPALENWSQFYGKRSMPEYAATIAYKLLRQVEVGAGAGSMRGKGQSYAVQHGIAVGNVTYELFPVNAFILVRGIVSEDQWLVPYVGGGWTRMYYREKIEDQNDVRGHADGYHARGGLQLSLDVIEQSSTNRMYIDYGVYHTSLFVEVEYSRAMVRSVSTNLGGTAYLGGLLFEF